MYQKSHSQDRPSGTGSAGCAAGPLRRLRSRRRCCGNCSLVPTTSNMRLAVILATAATVAAGRGSSTREEQLAAENAQLRAEVARLSLQTATPSSGGWVAPKIEGLEASKPNIMIIFGDDSADARASFLSGDRSSCGTRPSASILTQPGLRRSWLRRHRRLRPPDCTHATSRPLREHPEHARLPRSPRGTRRRRQCQLCTALVCGPAVTSRRGRCLQAATGSKLTQYYSGANICSPSRCVRQLSRRA